MKINYEQKGSRNGYTVLELTLVIIIVGVLAAVALPKYFSMLERSRTKEAIDSIGVIRRAVERCIALAECTAASADCDCNNISDLDIDDPGAVTNTHYSYSIGFPVTLNDYNIAAFRNNKDFSGPAIPPTYMTFCYEPTGVTKQGLKCMLIISNLSKNGIERTKLKPVIKG